MKLYTSNAPLFSLHLPKTGGSSLEFVLANWFNKRKFPNLKQHPRLSNILRFQDLDFQIQRLLGCGLYFHYIDHRQNKAPRPIKLGASYGLFHPQKQAECIHGHFRSYLRGESVFDSYPNASQFITVLREPLEMQISLYHYTKRLVEDGVMYWEGKQKEEFEFETLDEWLLERDFFLLKVLPWSFSKDNYRDVINEYFVHICVLEHFQQSIDILAQKLAFKPIRVPKVNATPRSVMPSSKIIKVFREKYDLEYMIYDYAKSLNQINISHSSMANQ